MTLDYQVQYRESHRELLRTKAAEIRASRTPEQTEAARAYQTAYRERNREKLAAAQRASRDKYREKDRRWRLQNPEKVAEQQRRRRARKKGAVTGPLSAEDWNAICSWADNLCAYCKASGRLTQDHVLALNRQGKHDVTNIVPACQSCNSSKQDKLVEDWRPGWIRPWWVTAA